MPRVLIIQKYVPEYRRPFFDRLRVEAERRGIVLDLAYGQPLSDDAAKGDAVAVPWGRSRPNWGIRLFGKSVYMQRGLLYSRGYDLVVVEHANRLLLNYALLLSARAGGPPVAFWGHGADLQSESPRGARARLKQHSARWAAHWFAYTDGSADRLRLAGVPDTRISVVQNTIDYDAFRTAVLAGRREMLPAAHAIYCGGLYEGKNLPFLIEAARRTRALVPNFTLVVAGDGPARSEVEGLTRGLAWVQVVGRVTDTAKADVFARASVFLIPGLVGLAAVDSLASETPTVTINTGRDSPEFEYLNELNSVILEAGATSERFGEEVASLLNDEDRLRRLREMCATDARKYSIDEMVRRFVDGIERALVGAS